MKHKKLELYVRGLYILNSQMSSEEEVVTSCQSITMEKYLLLRKSC